MIVVKPIKTLPISITGNYCALQCEHCKAHFLHSMTPLSLIEKKLYKNRYYKSFLISGGYNNEGVLPLTESSILELKKLKETGYKLNFHLGLVQEKDLKKLKGIPDMISFDLIFDDYVIKEVFHLKNKTHKNFEESYLLLRDNLKTKTSPHILIGARYGKIEREYEAIDFLEKYKPEKLIFIIITPLEETSFKSITLPSLREIEALWIYSKNKLPKTKFYLGCVRPKGKYRYEVDSLAVDLGFEAIVNPHSHISLSQSPKIFEECCALL